MNTKQSHTAKILTYCGTLPLIAASGFIIFFNPDQNIRDIAIFYSAIIIAFLSGVHWAAYLFFADKCRVNLLITSNVVALIAWASLLIKCKSIVLIVQILCFLCLLALDLNLRHAEVLPHWFYKLRCNATIIVVLCLSAIIVFSYYNLNMA